MSLTSLTVIRELERTFSILYCENDRTKTRRSTSIIQNSISCLNHADLEHLCDVVSITRFLEIAFARCVARK